MFPVGLVLVKQFGIESTTDIFFIVTTMYTTVQKWNECFYLGNGIKLHYIDQKWQ